MKIKILILFLIIFLQVIISYSQISIPDVLLLPRANAVQKDTFANRWGDMWNLVTVNFILTNDDKENFNYLLIEAEIKKKRNTYILFPTGGSETDIFIYPILKYTVEEFVYNKQVKKKIFTFSEAIEDKVIQIDDLPPGFYYVQYVSCHFGESYILWIKEYTEEP